MANTRDSIGDQATIDGLVSHTLTDLEESGALTVEGCALYANNTIENIVLPNAAIFKDYAFYNCTNLKKIDCQADGLRFYQHSIDGCCRLTSLILRGAKSNSVNSGVASTPIATGLGSVYVPTELVDSYKSSYAQQGIDIQPISAYPKTQYGTITDTWAEIKAAEANGTYLTKYNVGDTKNISIDGVPYFAQIVGLDLDSAADGSNSAHITWLLQTVLVEHHYMNQSNPWNQNALRTRLTDDILPYLDCKDYLVPVSTTFLDNSGSTQTCTDSIWVPSAREIFGESGYESSGCVYTNVFNSSSARTKTLYKSAKGWWLRSKQSAAYFYYVKSDGTISNDSTTSYYVVVGFCT